MFSLGDKVVIDRESESWKETEKESYSWAESLKESGPLIISEIKQSRIDKDVSIISFSNSIYVAEDRWLKKVK